MKYFDQTDAWTEDALIGGTHFPIVVQNISVADDAEIQRGELLCASITGGEFAPVSTADDADKILCIAADDFTADSLHTATNAYFAGVFNKEKIILGNDSLTADDFAQSLRTQNIHLTSLKGVD